MYNTMFKLKKWLPSNIFYWMFLNLSNLLSNNYRVTLADLLSSKSLNTFIH